MKYEQKVIEQPQNADLWLKYASSISDPCERARILTRAVDGCPQSAALWRALVAVRVAHLPGCSTTEYQLVREIIAKALYLHPKDYNLWTLLLDTFPCRRSFDAALRSETISDKQVWNLYTKWALKQNPIAMDVFTRQLEYDPESLSQLVTQLSEINIPAAFELAQTGWPKNWQLSLELLAKSKVEVPQSKQFFDQALLQNPKHEETIVQLEAKYLANNGQITELCQRLERAAKEASSIDGLNKYILMLQQASQESKDTVTEQHYKSFLATYPLLLNSVKIRRHPTRFKYWLERLSIASDEEKRAIFEEARKQPCEPGQMAELYIRFAQTISENEALDLLKKARLKYDEDKVTLTLARSMLEPPPVALQTLHNAVNGPLAKYPALWRNLLALSRKMEPVEETQRLYERCLAADACSMRLVVAHAEFLLQVNKLWDALKTYQLSLPKLSGSSLRTVWRSYIEISDRVSPEFQRQQYADAWKSCASDPGAAAGAHRGWLARRWSVIESQVGSQADVWRVLKLYLDGAIGSMEVSEAVMLCMEWAASVNHAQANTVLETILQKPRVTDRQMLAVSIEYARLNPNRASAILSWAVQFVDPEADSELWAVWREFDSDDTVEIARKQRRLEASSDPWLLSRRMLPQGGP